MKIQFSYVKLLPVILFLLAASNTLFGQILFQSSFEGANPFAGWSNAQSCCSHSVTASTTTFRDGAKAFRSEVRANDPSVSSGYRAELTLPNISDQGDMWYGWSMYFEANNAAGTAWTGQYGVTTQWHPQNSTGSAELALYADNGQFDITVNPSGGAGGAHQSSGLQNIIANRWYDIVFHVNWASSGGSVEVWIDGQPYFSKTNLSWAQGAYFKMGMNRWLMTNTWVVYYDNVKIGRNVTYNDVAPTPVTPGNQPPTANAGPDRTITLPTNFTTLNGSGADPDGTISSYAWSQVSGPSSPTLGSTASISLTGLVQGAYAFRLIVTDNSAAKDTDYVNVTVNPAANQPPVARITADTIRLILPANSTTLNGSTSTDADGTIASYEWTQLSGPAQSIIGNGLTANAQVSGLMPGAYTFQLRVTDDDGASSTETVVVLVTNTNGEGRYFNVYPNLTQANLTFQYHENGNGKIRVSIYDATRKLLKDGFVDKNQPTLTETIDVSALKNGMYFIQIVLPDGKTMAKQFVKM